MKRGAVLYMPGCRGCKDERFQKISREWLQRREGNADGGTVPC